MITDQDVQKIKEALKDDFATKEEFKDLKSEFSDFKDHVVKHMATKDEMMNGFDRVLKRIDDLNSEDGASFIRMNRHEGWINQLADHAKVELS